MLANSLTLEDEEAVQAELRELQLETVSPISSWLATPLIALKLGVKDSERPITLPSVPQEAPVSKGKGICGTHAFPY